MNPPNIQSKPAGHKEGLGVTISPCRIEHLAGSVGRHRDLSHGLALLHLVQDRPGDLLQPLGVAGVACSGTTFVRGWVDANIGDYFLNSFIVVLPSLVLILALSAMTAYVLARFPFPGNRVIFYLILAGMIFPIFLALIPLFFIVNRLNMLNTYQGLILVYVAYSLPFSVFFLTGFFKTLPSELHEAAIIDGANQYQVFFKVMLPLAQPGLISIGIFNFLGMWNQYLLPVVLMTNAKRYLLTQGLAYMLHQQYYQNDWSALFAAVTMIMVPTFMVYVIFQGQIQKGITVGALKG